MCTRVHTATTVELYVFTHGYTRYSHTHVCAQLQDTDTPANPSHLYSCTPLYPHTGTATGACTHVHTHLYVYTGMHSLTHEHTHERAHLQCVHACIHMHTQPTYSHMQTCTHLHMCTPRHTCTSPQPPPLPPVHTCTLHRATCTPTQASVAPLVGVGLGTGDGGEEQGGHPPDHCPHRPPEAGARGAHLPAAQALQYW